MGGFDKVFGLGLVAAGIFIAIYYSIWVFTSLKCMQKHVLPENFRGFFLPADWLFKLPAMTLIVGVIMIWAFISRTLASIEAEKQKKELEKKNKVN